MLKYSCFNNVVPKGLEPFQTEPKPVVLPLHHRTLFFTKVSAPKGMGITALVGLGGIAQGRDKPLPKVAHNLVKLGMPPLLGFGFLAVIRTPFPCEGFIVFYLDQLAIFKSYLTLNTANHPKGNPKDNRLSCCTQKGTRTLTLFSIGV